MKKHCLKLLAVLLCAVLLASSVPFTVFAEEDEYVEPIQVNFLYSYSYGEQPQGGKLPYTLELTGENPEAELLFPPMRASGKHFTGWKGLP